MVMTVNVLILLGFSFVQIQIIKDYKNKMLEELGKKISTLQETDKKDREKKEREYKDEIISCLKLKESERLLSESKEENLKKYNDTILIDFIKKYISEDVLPIIKDINKKIGLIPQYSQNINVSNDKEDEIKKKVQSNVDELDTTIQKKVKVMINKYNMSITNVQEQESFLQEYNPQVLGRVSPDHNEDMKIEFLKPKKDGKFYTVLIDDKLHIMPAYGRWLGIESEIKKSEGFYMLFDIDKDSDSEYLLEKTAVFSVKENKEIIYESLEKGYIIAKT